MQMAVITVVVIVIITNLVMLAVRVAVLRILQPNPACLNLWKATRPAYCSLLVGLAAQDGKDKAVTAAVPI